MTIKIRDYEVRLTRNEDERRAVRRLRYICFVEEEGASATEEQKQLREEYDSYDRFADYMGVFHGDKLVGTYRIIDRAAAEKLDGFYTETEYNLAKLKKLKGNIAEMSRACVAPEYRENGLAMRMLWLGLGDYVARNKIVALFGVASWVGKKPAEFAQAISYLYYNHLAPLSLRVPVLADNFADGVNPKLAKMNILPRAFVDEEAAKSQMTPLIKGYLRLGAVFGKGVFIDAPFNTCDVFVIMQSKKISAIYQKHFAGREDAFADLGIKAGAIKTIGNVLFSPAKGLALFARWLLKPEDAADVQAVED